MKERARTWWRGRSSREQWLLLALATLVFIALVYGAAFKPAFDWRRSQAQLAQTRETEFKLVADAARLASDGADAAGAQTPVRNALTDVAGQSGVDLIFVNARDDGSVDAQIGSAAPEKLFSMIERLERQYGVRVVSADIARVSDGASDLRAQVTLAR
jgi:type II secretory pathway component PulM